MACVVVCHEKCVPVWPGKGWPTTEKPESTGRAAITEEVDEGFGRNIVSGHIVFVGCECPDFVRITVGNRFSTLADRIVSISINTDDSSGGPSLWRMESVHVTVYGCAAVISMWRVVLTRCGYTRYFSTRVLSQLYCATHTKSVCGPLDVLT